MQDLFGKETTHAHTHTHKHFPNISDTHTQSKFSPQFGMDPVHSCYSRIKLLPNTGVKYQLVLTIKFYSAFPITASQKCPAFHLPQQNLLQTPFNLLCITQNHTPIKSPPIAPNVSHLNNTYKSTTTHACATKHTLPSPKIHFRTLPIP